MNLQEIRVSEQGWRAVIVILSIAVLLLTVWCLSHGITIIFMHLYYFPIVLLAYRYRWRGLYLSVLLGLAYLGLVMVYETGQPDVISGALYRFLVFVGIAAVIAWLSDRLHGAEEAAQKNRQFQENVIANATVWISVLAPDGTILVWNDAAEAISGYKKSDVVGKRTIWKQLYPNPEYRRNVTAEITRIIDRDNYLENVETVIRCENGAVRTIVWNTRSMRDPAGTVTGYIAIGRDVTPQKEAERRAGESSQFLETMIDTLPMPIFFKDRDGRYVGCNPPFEQYIGITRDQLMGKTVYDISPKDLADRYAAADRKVLENPAPQRYETQVQYADGSRHDVIFYKAPYYNQDGSVAGLIGAFLDITERKQMETALRESESFNRGLVENLPEYLCVYGVDGRILFVNPASARALGYDPEAVIGTHLLSYIPAEYHASILEKIKARIGGDTSSYEIELVARDKTRRTVIVKAAPVHYQNNPAVLLLLVDITGRKREEDALRRSNVMLETQQETSTDGILVVDEAGQILSFNRRFVEIMGIPPDIIASRDDSRVLAFATRKMADPEGFLARVQYLYEHRGEKSREEIRLSDGRTLERYSAPMLGEDDRYFGRVWYFHDITERKNAETALKASEALLNEVGRLAHIGGWELDLASQKVRWTEETFRIHDLPVGGPIDIGKAILYFDEPGRQELITAIDRCTETGEPYDLDLPFTSATGRHLWTRAMGRAERVDGTITKLTGTFQDITDLKVARDRIQELLRIQEEQLRIINTSPAVSFLWRAEENWPVDMVSENISQFGYTRDDFLTGRVLYSAIIHPEDLGRVGSEVEYNSTHGIDDYSQEYRISAKDGTLFWVDDYTHIRRDASGKITHYEGVVLDITERKRAQEALFTSERRSATLLSAIPDMMFIISRDGVYRDFRVPDPSVLAVPAEKIIGTNVRDSGFSREVTEVILHYIEQALGTKQLQVFEYGLLLPAGQRQYEARLVAMSEDEVLGIVRDITQRKLAEKEREEVRGWHEGLNRILTGVLAQAPLDEKLKIVTDGVVETFGADFCRIWLIDKGDRCDAGCMHAAATEGPHVCRYRDRCLHLRASSGRYTHLDGKAHRRVPFGAYKIGRIASGEESKFLTNDVQHDPRVHDHAWAADLGLVGFAGYQLKPPAGDVLGVFALFTRFPIPPDMDALLDVLSHAISMVIQKDRADRALVESERQTRESRQLFADIISFLPDPTFVIDKNGIVLAWNRAMEQLSGVPAEDILGRGDHEYSLWLYGKRRPIVIDLVLHPDQDAGRMGYLNIRRDGSTLVAETKVTLQSGREIALSLVASPLVDEMGAVTGAIESMRDISSIKKTEAELARLNANLEKIVKERTRALEEEIIQRKYAEQEVQSALEYTRSVIEANPDLMVVLDMEGRILDINAAGKTLTGIAREELLGQKYFGYLEDDGTLETAFDRLMRDGSIENFVRIRHTDGHRTPLSVHAIVVRWSGNIPDRIIVSAHDITKQKADEAAIKASLDEKVILLREIHHRVKNNLQIIISLTNLQMRNSTDPSVKQMMAETQNRVRAMSLVHEKLYRSESLSQIDFAEYTRFLATQLFSFYTIDTRRVNLDVTLRRMMVDINTAVPLGLIMNELVSNALKHAFSDGRKGTLAIRGGTDEKGQITLVIGDDGVGVPPDFDLQNSPTLGMRLVTSLVDQIGGSITLDTRNGTVFTIAASIPPYGGGKE